MRLDELPPLLTAGEVSKVLRKGRNWPYDAVRDGLLRAVRIGRSLRIPRGEVERLLAEGGGGGASDAP